MDRGRTGETKSNKCGTLMKIIKDNGSSVIVEFQDEHKYQVETIYQNFEKCQIKNPYDKTVFGVGYVGGGGYAPRINGISPSQYVWHDMMERCYSDKLSNVHNSYYGISTVCEEWHNYQNFAKWYNNNFYIIGYGRMHLDKDILVPGNKEYNPQNCMFVPQRINMLFSNKPNKRGLPNGITKIKSGYKAVYNTYIIGTYGTVEEAYIHYAEVKEYNIKEIAEEYKNKIPKRLYEALINYKVLLKNDKNYSLCNT